ncbi:MAG: 1-phosphofructokinase family hexose kinase [Anaerolineae bacterium]
MILCVNAHAAIDQTIVIRRYTLNAIHRPEQGLALPGGKGANVARACKLLGETPVVAGWVGGHAGQFIEQGLAAEGIGTDLVHTDQESRTCLSIIDPDAHTLTELDEQGEPIPADKLREFRRRFETTVDQYAAVTLSGSLPPGVPDDFYAQLLEIARAAGVPTILDTSGEPLRLGLAGGPIVVKPNRHELAALVGHELNTAPHILAAAVDLATFHHLNVVVSLGAEGAIATNGALTLHIRPPAVPIISAVGSGDALVAGIAYGLVHALPIPEAVKQGVAAGTANALTLGAGRFSLDDFNRILSQVSVTRD